MKTRMKLPVFLTLIMVLVLGMTAVVWADDMEADADSDALTTPRGNGVTTSQTRGSTVEYEYSAAIYNDKNKPDNDVFQNTDDYVDVIVEKAGAWADSISVGKFTFKAYEVSQYGKVKITVPCNAGNDPVEMSVKLSATASNGEVLKNSPTTLTYLITPSGSCPVTDTTKPEITSEVKGTLGNNGWYTSDVTVSWSVVDDESPISSSSGCDPTTIDTDTAGQTLTCEATSAGGKTSVSVTIKRDATPPTATGSASPAANANGWNNTDVTVTWSCSDSGSGVVDEEVSQTVSTEGANQSVEGTCEDHAGNKASDTQTGINIDKTAPTASASASPAANANGWNNSDVTVSFEGDDELSGIASCADDVVLSAEGAGQSASGTCTDKAGNESDPATVDINIDWTAPVVSLVGGPADGVSYYFGFVPAAPTCSASDALSGVDGACAVSGYGTSVGTHTVTASATDLAGNTGSAFATYEVLAWTLKGFYQPVDMNGVYNTVKGGSTVPLKFEVFAGSTELTSTSVVAMYYPKKVVCGGSLDDAIETTATGGTSLRYDTVAGQFVYNWQTPKEPGACYMVTVKTQDGSHLDAFFKLK